MRGSFEDVEPVEALRRSISRSMALLAKVASQTVSSCLGEAGSPLPDSPLEILRSNFVAGAAANADGLLDVVFLSHIPDGTLPNSRKMVVPPSSYDSGSDLRLLEDSILLTLFSAYGFCDALGEAALQALLNEAPFLREESPFVQDVGRYVEKLSLQHTVRILRFDGSGPELQRLLSETVAACKKVPDEEVERAMETSRRARVRYSLERAISSAVGLLTEEEVSGLVDLARVRSVMES
jgi:hypothetical protein